MHLAIVVLIAVLAAIARRIDGGWLGWSKSVSVALTVTILSAVAIGAHWPLAVWITPPWGRPLPELSRQIVVILAVLWYVQGGLVPGGDFSRPWTLVARYGAAPGLVGLLYGFWPVALVGPLVAGLDALRMNWGPVALPWDSATERMIDSGEAYYEFGVGGFGAGLAFAAAPIWGAW